MEQEERGEGVSERARKDLMEEWELRRAIDHQTSADSYEGCRIVYAYILVLYKIF